MVPDRLPPRTRTILEKADDLADDIIDIAGLLSSILKVAIATIATVKVVDVDLGQVHTSRGKRILKNCQDLWIGVSRDLLIAS